MSNLMNTSEGNAGTTKITRPLKKQRIRNRPKHPRPIQLLGKRVDPRTGIPRPMSILRLYWPKEQDFQAKCYQEIKQYLLERQCEVHERPQYSDQPGPNRTLYVRFDRGRGKRNQNTIKRQVSRLKCGMHTQSVESIPEDQEEAVSEEAWLKGA